MRNYDEISVRQKAYIAISENDGAKKQISAQTLLTIWATKTREPLFQNKYDKSNGALSRFPFSRQFKTSEMV